jgi:hypothetical protein
MPNQCHLGKLAVKKSKASSCFTQPAQSTVLPFCGGPEKAAIPNREARSVRSKADRKDYRKREQAVEGAARMVNIGSPYLELVKKVILSFAGVPLWDL